MFISYNSREIPGGNENIHQNFLKQHKEGNKKMKNTDFQYSNKRKNPQIFIHLRLCFKIANLKIIFTWLFMFLNSCVGIEFDLRSYKINKAKSVFVNVKEMQLTRALGLATSDF